MLLPGGQPFVGHLVGYARLSAVQQRMVAVGRVRRDGAYRARHEDDGLVVVLQIGLAADGLARAVLHHDHA